MSSINAKWVGKVLLHFDELPSTNDYARFYAQQNPDSAAGVAVRATAQTAGRGQMGAAWESAPGLNLTLSVLFQPRWLRAERQFAWGQAVALAVAHTAAEFIVEGIAMVKWPNDVLIEEKKVAGILIENTVSGSFISNSIVGIGLNINQLHFSRNLTQAASLSAFAHTDLNIDAVQARLFAHLEAAYERLERGDERGIHREYLDRLFAYGRQAQFMDLLQGQAFSGAIVNVDTDGKLCIQTEEGMRRFGQKEIKFTFAAP